MIPLSPSKCRWLSAFLILASTGLHWAYLVGDCPLDLAPDEAHYWDWSRRLDWSYYSKGPLVAWLIRGSCQLWGDSMAAVRLPAVVSGALLLAGLQVLTVQVSRSDRLALLVVAGALTLPAVWAVSTLMTIDAPYLCLWTWALVLGHQAVVRHSWWAWPLLGIAVGLGILAKYTMVLFLPSLGLFLLTSAEQRRQLLRPGIWTAGLIAGFLCLPILLWNIKHDWVSYRHLNTLAGMENRFQPLGPLVYVGQQLVLLLGFWFVVWLLAMWAFRPWRDDDAGRRYLWWLSAPMFGVFWLFSFRTGGGEINWPATAYLSGLVLGACWLTQALAERGRLTPVARGALRFGAVTAGVVGLAGVALMHCTHQAYPFLARLAGPATPDRPLPLRRLDPTCRLRGWQTLAAEVDRLRDELRREGVEPVLAGSHWWLPGQLAFYCQDRPAVYCLGPAVGSRNSQYDLWRPNPLRDPDQFAGRTFILVGEVTPNLRDAFERIDTVRLVRHQVQGHPVSAWQLTVARGYRSATVPAQAGW